MLIVSKRENDVKLRVQITEDLWHLEKIIAPGDLVTAKTQRKFVTDSGKSERKPATITIEVEKVSFHKPSEKLRVLGTIVSGRPEELVQIGSHHSLDVGEGDVLKIQKKKWRGHELDRIKEAQKAAKQPKLHALILDEREAEVFVIRQYGIDSLGKASVHGRGKYAEESKDIKNKYYDKITSFLQNLEGIIIIAGPGFERENYHKFLKDNNSVIVKQIRVQAINDTGRSGVRELVDKGIIDSILKESRFALETSKIEELVAEIGRTPSNATYGAGKVMQAINAGAVGTLLVIDDLLFEKRDEVELIIDKAEKLGSRVLIVSHENEASEKLKAFGGIAAILRFSIE